MPEQTFRGAHPATLHGVTERYFQVSLYLLIASGFATIAGTGKLDIASVLFVSTALLVRGYMLVRNRKFLIPERWTSYFTLAYVAFYPLDYFLFSGSFVNATVHMVLFGMVVKIFSVRRDRDYLYLAVLAFLEILAASVLTVDTVFLAAFTVFLLLAVSTFISFEMKRSLEASSVCDPEKQTTVRMHGLVPRNFGVPLSAASLAILLTIIVGGGVFFFLLPRISAGYLSALAPKNQLVSGFSDSVNLGEIGEIKQSSSVVMHVQIAGDRSGGNDQKWRGIALALFDGKRWFNPMQKIIVPASGDGRFYLRDVRVRWKQAFGDSSKVRNHRELRYHVVMEPIGTNVFFLAPIAQVVVGEYREISMDVAGSVFNTDRDRQIGAYDAISDIPTEESNSLRLTGADYPPEIALRYLQLPKLDPRVRKLAEQISSSSKNEYDKAVAIENYLKTHYGYTLQLTQTSPADPLSNFLFDRKEGHCEYFASSMTVLLRTIGIPARLVNGFRGGEFNDLTDSYIIRARDAHSWVEAYFPSQGWVSFDPTPPDPKSISTRWTRMMLYMDAMREFWREWIINYDFVHQRTLTTSATMKARWIVSNWQSRAEKHYREIVLHARKWQQKAWKSPGRWSSIFVGITCVLLVIWNMRRLLRAVRNHRLARKPERSPVSAATIWYTRMSRYLARRGWKKLPTQTPQEYADSIDNPVLRTSVARFTEHYECARFGASAVDAQRLPELLEEVKSK